MTCSVSITSDMSSQAASTWAIAAMSAMLTSGRQIGKNHVDSPAIPLV